MQGTVRPHLMKFWMSDHVVEKNRSRAVWQKLPGKHMDSAPAAATTITAVAPAAFNGGGCQVC